MEGNGGVDRFKIKHITMKLLYAPLLSLISLSVFAQQFDFYGPEPFDQILDNAYSTSWNPTAVDDFTNLSYVIVMNQDKSNALTIAGDLASASMTSIDYSNTTYGEVLQSIFQLVDINTHEDNNSVPLNGDYQIKPFLHSYFALTSNSGNEVLPGDAGSMFVADADQSGYFLLNFTGSPDNAKIKAISHWEWSGSDFSETDNWTERWLAFGDNGSLTLTENEVSAGSFFLADAHDLFDLEIADGSDFNPNATAHQPNATAAIPDDVTDIAESRLLTDLSQKIDADLQDQLGTSAAADAATSSALDAIETTLTEAGLKMRYPKEFYVAARSAMLAQVIASSDIYGARLGYNTIPHVYFTNASDDNGDPHPFMVITSHAVSTRPNQLVDVDRPPGAEQGVGYGETTVTRNGKLGEFLMKIPIRDYGLIDDLFDNNLDAYNDLASDYDDKEGTSTTKTVYNYTSLVSNGVAIDGVTIYPAQNNNLRFAVEDAEVTHSGIHVGGGLELHYHADGHAYSSNGINLYNLEDYEGHDHPPVIGFAYDGIALFGRYEPNFPMTGDDVALDEYGGHDHEDGFGYHYHAHDEQHTASQTSTSFTEHFLLVGAWKGQINDIPGFLELKTNQFEDPDIARYAGASYEEGGGGGGPMMVLGVNPGDVNVYPNPSQNFIVIDAKEAVKLSLFNMNGELVYSNRESKKKIRIDLSNLAAGTYLLHIIGKNNQTSRKLILH